MPSKATCDFSLTIVIPAHNEEASIAAAVSDVLSLRSIRSDLLRVRVVDDGSTDRTVAVAAAIAAMDPRLSVVSLPHNIGANRAIFTGVSACDTDLVAFLPADGQVKADQLSPCIEAIDRADIVWTRRVSRADPWVRRAMARIYNSVVRGLLRVPVHDVDSIFLLRREPVQDLFETLVSRSDFLPVEFLLRAERRRLRIVEVDVVHCARQAGKPSAVSGRAVFATMGDLVRMRLRSRVR